MCNRPPQQDSLHKMHILLVEDDGDMAAMLQAVLGAEGYRVTTVANSKGALALFPAALSPGPDQVDLVLVDLTLPNGGGLELMRERIRREYALPLIVLLQVQPTVDAAPAADMMHAVAVIQKPFEVAFLLATIRQTFSSESRPETPDAPP